MKEDTAKGRSELLAELVMLRQRVKELEALVSADPAIDPEVKAILTDIEWR